MCIVLLPLGDNPIAVNNIYIYIYAYTIYMAFKTWSVLLRGQHRLRLFENRVLRKFGPKRGKVPGDCNREHNEMLHDLYH